MGLVMNFQMTTGSHSRTGSRSRTGILRAMLTPMVKQIPILMLTVILTPTVKLITTPMLMVK